MKGGRQRVSLIAFLVITVVVACWCWLWLPDLFSVTPSRKLNGVIFTGAMTALVVLLPGTVILAIKKKREEREGIRSAKAWLSPGEVIRTSAEFWGMTSLLGMVAFMTLIFLAGTIADSLIDWSSVVEAITSLLQLGR